MENIGKLILGIGIILSAIGLLLWLFGSRLEWLGNLPGDIKIERPGFRLYFPFATMLLISLGLSFAMWLISKFTPR
jgi:Protein of unknown function (DUF2905)